MLELGRVAIKLAIEQCQIEIVAKQVDGEVTVDQKDLFLVLEAGRAYLDATAPSRAPTREITMQDVRLIAGEGKLDAAIVLDAVNAHLRREASRAPDGGVTREEVARLIEPSEGIWTGREHVASDLRKRALRAADAILARLSASHARDRERWALESVRAELEIARDGLAAAKRSGQTDVKELVANLTPESKADAMARAGMFAKIEMPFIHLEQALRRVNEALAPASGQDDEGEAERG